MSSFDLIAMGRIGVAVAATRYGRRSAVAGDALPG